MKRRIASYIHGRSLNLVHGGYATNLSATLSYFRIYFNVTIAQAPLAPDKLSPWLYMRLLLTFKTNTIHAIRTKECAMSYIFTYWFNYSFKNLAFGRTVVLNLNIAYWEYYSRTSNTINPTISRKEITYQHTRRSMPVLPDRPNVVNLITSEKFRKKLK